VKAINFIIYRIISYFGSLFYFTGLTALIPLLPLVFINWQSVRFSLFSALFFIIIGFGIIISFSTYKRALRVLGWTTLLPGIIAVFFNFFGKNKFFSYISRLDFAEHLVENYINIYVPSSWFLAGIFIILGAFMVFLSEKLSS